MQGRVVSMRLSFLSSIDLLNLLNELITSKCLEAQHAHLTEVIDLKNVFSYYEHDIQKSE